MQIADNEITRALECCASSTALCQECPHFTVPFPTCKELTTGKALELIARQKAEIKKLKAESENHSDECLKCYAKGLSEGGIEAVKKFAESLKEDIINIQMNGEYQHYAIPTKKVDKLLKEMGLVE